MVYDYIFSPVSEIINLKKVNHLLRGSESACYGFDSERGLRIDHDVYVKVSKDLKGQISGITRIGNFFLTNRGQVFQLEKNELKPYLTIKGATTLKIESLLIAIKDNRVEVQDLRRLVHEPLKPPNSLTKFAHLLTS